MTREEAVKWLEVELRTWESDCKSKHVVKDALKMAIKALEQEPKTMVEIDLYSVIKQKYIEREVLDKIRAEIEEYRDSMRWNSESLVKWEAINYVLEHIIDKYKAESENKK